MKKTTASVTTVVPPSSEERKILNTWIKKNFAQVERVNFLIDKKILGGIIIQVDDQLVDRSLARLLSELSEKLSL